MEKKKRTLTNRVMAIITLIVVLAMTISYVLMF